MSSRSKGSIIFNFLFISVFTIAIIMALGYNHRARLAPLVVSIPGLLVVVIRLVKDLISNSKSVTDDTKENKQELGKPVKVDSTSKTKTNWQTELNAFAWIIGLFILLYMLGFVLAIPIYLFLFMKVRSKEKSVFSFAFSLISCAFLYLFFGQILHIPLYEGMIAKNLF